MPRTKMTLLVREAYRSSPGLITMYVDAQGDVPSSQPTLLALLKDGEKISIKFSRLLCSPLWGLKAQQLQFWAEVETPLDPASLIGLRFGEE